MKKILIISILSLILIISFVNAVPMGYCEQDSNCTIIPSGCCQECNENNELINLQAVNLHDRDEWREDCESKGILCTAQACELAYITLCEFNICELIPLVTPEIHKLEPNDNNTDEGKISCVAYPCDNGYLAQCHWEGDDCICEECPKTEPPKEISDDDNEPIIIDKQLPTREYDVKGIIVENDIGNYKYTNGFYDAMTNQEGERTAIYVGSYVLGNNEIYPVNIIEYPNERTAINYLENIKDKKEFYYDTSNYKGLIYNLKVEARSNVIWKNNNKVISIYGEDKLPEEIVVEYLKKYPSDIPLSESKCGGCLYEDLCVPFGTGKEGKYCDITKKFLPKKQEGSSCDNNYECKSNECSDSKCVSTYNLLEKIWNWLINLI